MCKCSWLIRHLNVVIVYATLMIDNMLLTSVVPVLPEYFFEQQESDNETKQLNPTSIPSLTSSTYNNHTSINKSELSVALENLTRNGTTSTVNGFVVGCAEKSSKEAIAAQNIFLAFLLASKPLVQLIANIFVGPVCDKFGFDIPMQIGYVVITASSLIFAFGSSYAVLFTARALQGIGSACAATAGMAMLASQYQDDDERGRMLGVALSGLATGVLIGPSFAGLAYQLSGGKELPFIILAIAAALVALLRIFSMVFGTKHFFQTKAGSSMIGLLKDPYILVAAGALVLGNVTVGVMETSLPTWLLITLCAEEWQLGLAMLPVAVSYLIVTAMFSHIDASKYRWLICFLSFFVSATGSILLSICKTFLQIMGPCLLIGTATGMVDATVFPILGYLADTRHVSIYGAVYAIGDAAFCVAFIVGPLLAGTIVHEISFKWVMIIAGALNVVFSPFVLFLKNPPGLSEERKGILSDPDTNREEDERFATESMSLGRILRKQDPYDSLH